MWNKFFITFHCLGTKFPARNSAQCMLTTEAKFDGQTMVTDPVAHVESPNFTQELAWPVDSKSLHQHRLQRSAVKVTVSSSDVNAGTAGREEIGYVVLNLRAAQHEKVSFRLLLVMFTSFVDEALIIVIYIFMV